MHAIPIAAAFLASLSLVDVVTAASSAAWSTRRIYFAMTDRFARSDGSTKACGNLHNYCGGTWKGMESKLPYIKELGFDAIWITPVVENTDGGYHGYWAKNIYTVNEKHGTAEELKSLVKAAHSQDIYVMVDVVVNHMGKGDFSHLYPFNSTSHYHDYCVISDYNNQDEVEQCRFVPELPDIKTEDPFVRSIFNSWIRDLVKTYGFDGLRIDTTRHVETSFYSPFLKAAGNPFAIGEVFHGDSKYVGGYQHHVPGVFNYPLYWSLTRVFLQNRTFQDLVNEHDKVSGHFPRPELLGTFIDNHDVPRFMSQTSDKVLLKNVLAYVILARGIPIVYYGTEFGYMGAEDPANREDLWRMGWTTGGDIFKFIQLLNSVRKQEGGLGNNDHVHLYVEGNAYAFSRGGGKVVVLTTNLGGKGYGSVKHCFDTKMKEGTEYKSAISQQSYVVDGSGYVCVVTSGGMPDVLVLQKSNIVKRLFQG